MTHNVASDKYKLPSLMQCLRNVGRVWAGLTRIFMVAVRCRVSVFCICNNSPVNEAQHGSKNRKNSKALVRYAIR